MVQVETVGAAAGQATAIGQDNRRKWWVLVAMVFGLFMPMLDSLVVNVALPTIQRRLGAGVSELQWIIDAYTLTFATFMLTGGTLADKFGRKRFFIGGLVIFSLGSLLCGLATSMDELIAFRAVQGIGGSLLLPGSLAIISATFHGRERGAAIGIWSAMSGIAVAVGPLVGGYLVQNVNWQSIFFINVPIGAVAVVLTYLVVRDSRDTSGLRRLDPPGAVLGTLGLFFLVYATIEGNSRGWTDGLILGSYALAAIFLVGFVWTEMHRESPMLPLSLFRNPTFSASIGTAIAVFFALFGMTFFISLYLQNVVGYDPVATGIRMVPFTIMLLLIAPVAGRLSDRYGSRWFMAGGTALLAGGLALSLRMEVGSSYMTVILPAMLLMGAGMALTMAPLSSAVMGSVEPRRAGVASATQTTSQQIGGVFGIALLGAIVTAAFNNYFRSHLLGLGLSSSTVNEVVSKVGAGAAAGAVPRGGVPGVPAHVGQAVVSAVYESFVQAFHDGLYVSIGFALLASVLAATFVRNRPAGSEMADGSPQSPEARTAGQHIGDRSVVHVG
ncbi:MAG TPA: MFS transporter [Acidimicrobiales bacterium]|nr:MFS transporter [Acidimicrobiales bacterium]